MKPTLNTFTVSQAGTNKGCGRVTGDNDSGLMNRADRAFLLATPINRTHYQFLAMRMPKLLAVTQKVL